MDSAGLTVEEFMNNKYGDNGVSNGQKETQKEILEKTKKRGETNFLNYAIISIVIGLFLLSITGAVFFINHKNKQNTESLQSKLDVMDKTINQNLVELNHKDETIKEKDKKIEEILVEKETLFKEKMESLAEIIEWRAKYDEVSNRISSLEISNFELMEMLKKKDGIIRVLVNDTD